MAFKEAAITYKSKKHGEIYSLKCAINGELFLFIQHENGSEQSVPEDFKLVEMVKC